MYESYINARDWGATGSRYETAAITESGSAKITVGDVGDFKVGDEVLLSGGGYRYVSKVFSERPDRSPINPRKRKYFIPIEDRIELEGELSGDWLVYMIDICPEEPDVFRWSVDFGRSWSVLPITSDFTDLDGMAKVRINEFEERQYGVTAAFVFTDRLVTTITAIDGNTVTLADAAERCGECTLCHSDTLGIQRAIDAAIESGKSVFLPNGTYRLTKTLRIENAVSLTFSGESAEGTVIDNSLGAVGVEKNDGAVFTIIGGTEVNIKNLSMYGNSGFADRDICGNIRPLGSEVLWGFYFRKTNATYVHNTKRVYLKNCHAKRMSAECFYASSNSRTSEVEPKEYPISIIYDRCSVEDCARNAFNNNDKAEGTSLINCRVRDVGGCAWEGASRFVKITGCYFRNAGSIALGNVRSRSEDLELLPTGQHIITNNYFESGCPYGRAMIRVGSWATQVIISNNVFTNFNSNAIEVFGECGHLDAPSENVIISSNSLDMTAVESLPKKRCAIRLTSSYVTVADNHISVRGECDPTLTAITVSDDATRINLHDNIIAGVGVGITTKAVSGTVGKVVDDIHFYRSEEYEEHKPMLLRRRSHLYRGWRIRFSDGEECVLDGFDAETKCFTLRTPRSLTVGESFELYPKEAAAPIMIRANILENCDTPLDLDTESGKRALTRDNVIFNS